MFWDLFDDILGPLNLINRVTGWLQIATRRGSRKRQRYGRTAMVRVTIPRSDKTPGAEGFKSITNHLKKYGCDTYDWTHDSRNFYVSVAKNQYPWFQRLYNGGQLWSPASSWADKPRGRRR